MNEKNISFIFEKNKNSITFPANGAIGGPTPDSSGVMVHFYVEYSSVPHSTTIKVEDKHVINPLGESITRGDITREIQASTFLTPDVAILIGKWLIASANEIKNRPNNPKEL